MRNQVFLSAILLLSSLICGGLFALTSAHKAASSHSFASTSEARAPSVSRFIESFQSGIDRGDLRTENCARTLSDFTSVAKMLIPNPSASSTDVPKTLFHLRLAVAKRLARLQSTDELPLECLQAHREFIRIVRLSEDMFGEAASGNPAYAETAQPFRGSEPALLVNPDFSRASGGNSFTDFKSGDVFIARGKTFTGAAIGRMADYDSTFSHMGLIYIDPATKQFYTIESFMEKGVQIYALDKFEKPDKARMALYRHRDPHLAARAAQFMFEEVTSRNARGQNFAYDFRLNPADRNSLYCSEVVQHAFETASGERRSERVESSISTRNRDFFDRFEMVGKKAFLPTDIEIDSDFELVAEWRDFARTNDARMKDAVLSAEFDWMDRFGYTLREPAGIRFKSFAAANLRGWPLFSEYLRTRVPKGIPDRALGAFLTLHEVSISIYTELAKENERFKSANGLWMTDAEMMDFIERLRVSDLAAYRDRTRRRAERTPILIHGMLRANNPTR